MVKLRGRRVWPPPFPCIRLRRNLRKMSQANFETFSQTWRNHEGQIFWQFLTKANTFNYHSHVLHMYHSKPKTLLEIPRPLSICPLISSEYSDIHAFMAHSQHLLKYTQYCNEVQPMYVFIYFHIRTFSTLFVISGFHMQPSNSFLNISGPSNKVTKCINCLRL